MDVAYLVLTSVHFNSTHVLINGRITMAPFSCPQQRTSTTSSFSVGKQPTEKEHEHGKQTANSDSFKCFRYYKNLKNISSFSGTVHGLLILVVLARFYACKDGTCMYMHAYLLTPRTVYATVYTTSAHCSVQR